jgi:choline kinase
LTDAEPRVREAVILAAGDGDRFVSGSHESKLLSHVVGVPLIVRTLMSAYEAGIRQAHVVLGFEADRVRAAVTGGVPSGIDVGFIFNPEWQHENGISVLSARGAVEPHRFALLMGDHVFHWRMLRHLLNVEPASGESLLAIDRRPAAPQVVAEATKVATTGNLVTAIGKDLAAYDAVDMGLFVFNPAIFGALERARASGDTTLSGGVRMLAATGAVRAVDVGHGPWWDVDTIDDLEVAEAIVRRIAHLA